MFNHQNFKLSHAGVENYFWPVNRANVTNLYQTMIKDSAHYFKNLHCDTDDKFYEHLKIINLYFILKLVDSYQKKSLSESIRNLQGEKIDANIFDSESNKNSNKYLEIVKDRFWPDVSKAWVPRKLRNKIATRLRNDGFIRYDLCDVDMTKGIVLTGVNPLASKLVKRVNTPVFLVKITDFFPGANPEDIQKQLKRGESEYFNSMIFNEYIKIFTNVLDRHSVEFSQADFSELYNWHTEFSLCVSYYQNLLMNQQYGLPEKLWTSSAGILWNKLLAMEVRKRGGVVTGFDHAEGATLTTETVFPFIEFQEVDTFVTHSPTFVSYLTEASHYQLYTEGCPAIRSIK